MSNPADEHRRIAGAFTVTVESTAPAAWDNPAPPEGWVARDVVRHLVEWFPAFLQGATGISVPAGPSVDDDPVGAWRIQTDLGERLVRVDRTTRFEPASVSPRVGDTVAVRALVAEGRYYAEKIDFVDTASYQTLEGVVEELGPGQKPAWLKVAGTLVAVGDETMIQGPLELGAGVTVLAKKYPDGNLVAETITIHSAPQGERIAFDGVLQEGRLDGTSQVWEVDRYTVRIPAGVVINGLPSGSPPPLGRRVQGIGRLDGAEVVAESISVLPDPVITSSAGIVTWMPPIGLLGEWRVETGDGHEIRFRVESLSALDTRVAPAERGMLARLRLQDSGDGQLPLALRVRMDWPD